MFRLIIALLLGFIIGNYSYSGTIHHNVQDSTYIEYGKNIECVAKLLGVDSEQTRYSASCVIVKNRWIITAAHVVSSNMSYVVEVGDKTIEVKEFLIHPDFNDKILGSPDLALGFLADNAEISFIPELYSENDEVNKIACIVGFGTTGKANLSARVSDDRKRAGTNRIDKIYKESLICHMDDKNSTVYEFCIMPGDSGGGLFIDKKLAGINSLISVPRGVLNGSYGTESYFTRISSPAVYKWINFILNE